MGLALRLLASTASIAWLAVNAPAQAQTPQAPTVAAGSIAITRQGATTVVNQTTDRGIIDWRSFSIGAGETVRFDQPGRSSVTLNRVTGPELSRIDGNLSANGQVWLANPNGVLIGNSGQVNVGGLLATTGRVDAAEFLKSGRAAIDQIGKESGISNFGTVNIAEGGYAALAAASIRNEGIVAARKGSVALGAGKAVTVDFTGDKLITFQVTKPLDQAVSGDSMISVGGKIAAEGGTVLMSARAAKGVMDNVVNLKGHVIANSVTVDGGTVSFGDGGIVQVSGKIDASNAGGKGGQVSILGEKVGLMDGASMDASGALGGGTVLVGGDWQGKGPSHNATIAYVAPTASINVDATMAGDGGKAVVWADDSTRFNGSISARGGVLAGNGGQVETSGKRALDVSPLARVTSKGRAAGAKAGGWLLDPTDITIVSTGGAVSLSGGSFTPTGASTTIDVGVINTALNNGDNVTLQTASAGSGAGDITFAAGTITTSYSGSALTLTLLASRNIIFNSSAALSLSGAAHNVTLIAGAGATTQSALVGGVKIDGASIKTDGGTIAIAGGKSGTLSASGSASIGGGGVRLLNGAVIDAGSGVFKAAGVGGSYAGADAPGVEINGSTVKAAGGMTLTGTGGDSATATSLGVYISGSTLSYGGGAALITGTAGTGTGAAGNHGVSIVGTSSLTGSGALTVTGIGGGSAASSKNYGVFVEKSSVAVSGSGAITLTGTRGLGDESHNVSFGTSAFVSTKSGAILINATSTVGGDDNAYGVSQDVTSKISTVDGDITVKAKPPAAGANNSDGFNAGVVEATGAGSITVIATLGKGTVSEGLYINGGSLSTVGGNITVTVTTEFGGGGGIAVRGVSVEGGGQIVTKNGTISINTVSDPSAGGDSNGLQVWGGAKIRATGSGSIDVTSTKGGGSGVGFKLSPGAFELGSGTLTVKTDSVSADSASAISGGSMVLQGLDGSKSIGVGGASGDLAVPTSFLTQISSDLQIGSDAQTAGITIAGSTTLPGKTTFKTGSGAVNFAGALTLAADVSVVSASGAITFGGPVSGAGKSLALSTNGASISLPAMTLGSLSVTDPGGSVAQSGPLTVGALSLQGAGATYALTDGGNAISALTATVGGLSLVNGPGTSLTVSAGGISVSGALSLTQTGAGRSVVINGPINLGSSPGSISSEGVITGSGVISSGGGALTLSAGAAGGSIEVNPGVKVGFAPLSAVVTVAVVSPPPTISPPASPTAETSASLPTVDAKPSTPTVAVTPVVETPVVKDVVPTEVSTTTKTSVVSPGVTTGGETVGGGTVGGGTGILADTAPVQATIGAEPTATVMERLMTTISTPPTASSPTAIPVMGNEPEPNAKSDEKPAAATTATAAEAVRRLSDAVPAGALIPPSSPIVPGTGAPLSVFPTVRVDAADAGVAGGQVIAAPRAGESGSNSKSVIKGMLNEELFSRNGLIRREPPLAEQASTINEEQLLD